MAQSRIEELVRDLKSRMEEVNEITESLDEEVDGLIDKSFVICFEKVHVRADDYGDSLSIPMQDLFAALSEKSKQFAGLKQFIEAIEKL